MSCVWETSLGTPGLFSPRGPPPMEGHSSLGNLGEAAQQARDRSPLYIQGQLSPHGSCRPWEVQGTTVAKDGLSQGTLSSPLLPPSYRIWGNPCELQTKAWHCDCIAGSSAEATEPLLC